MDAVYLERTNISFWKKRKRKGWRKRKRKKRKRRGGRRNGRGKRREGRGKRKGKGRVDEKQCEEFRPFSQHTATSRAQTGKEGSSEHYSEDSCMSCMLHAFM